MRVAVRRFPLVCIPLILLVAGHATAAEPAASQKAPFVAPYPQRTNPFRLPDSKAALATRREAVVQQITLQLKGFINVGTPRAVLEIDGQVTTLAVGERQGDIEVLEIAPPLLTLQRGRHRWTETLHDSTGQVARAGR